MSRRQNESEEEELKRLERNRVAFEAWLQKKNEEKKNKLAMERAAQRELADSKRQSREVGRMAFQRWLTIKHNEDFVRKKENAYLDKVEKIKQQNKAEEQRRAKEKFEMWKSQKDFESRLQRQNDAGMTNLLSSPPRESTPSLPGYVSVWSCDSELAELMVDKVDRGTQLLTPHTNTILPDSLTPPSN